MLTTISSAFQKPFACNAWTGKTVRPLEPSAFILLIKYTEHSPNLESGVKSINWHTLNLACNPFALLLRDSKQDLATIFLLFSFNKFIVTKSYCRPSSSRVVVETDSSPWRCPYRLNC
uniref:hypothetical protein n=1 Tax=Arctium tomentosum TaxID=4218 RepID=UPI001D0F9937|nr:hypothetical protein LK293_mgp068 [Arctium tomentosum]YP_010194957.1 hypothetical protein LK294_mgp069 [Arctium lappa]QZZ81566.1 hypothetical protein [Arctium tomentosum]QZZ81696.1 hypothetical protein [Arctium lappa]